MHHAFVYIHFIAKILLLTIYHEPIFFWRFLWSIALNLFCVIVLYERTSMNWDFPERLLQSKFWLEAFWNVYNYYLLKANKMSPAFSFCVFNVTFLLGFIV